MSPRARSTDTTAGSPPGGRRERRRSDVRERLFRAALRVFARKGFAESTCEDITNAADVGKGTFFNYFPSKEHILIAFADMQLGKLRAFVEEVQRAPGPSPQLLRELSERITAEPSRSPEMARLLLLANLSSEPVRTEMRRYQDKFLALLTQLIQIGQDRGEIRRDRPAEEIATAFRHLVFGSVLLWSLRPEVPLKERIDKSFAVLWHGMAAPRMQRK